ncbi:MAG: hypothetical protein M9935_04630 [Kiritimatiellae bacterium]|nr:hypothetical protein [Kiritimatiellia bacterium]
MPLTLRKVEGIGPVPADKQILWLSCCEQCLFWERTHYHVVGNCRRYPYPKMYAWQKCEHWSNRHGRASPIDIFAHAP